MRPDPINLGQVDTAGQVKQRGAHVERQIRRESTRVSPMMLPQLPGPRRRTDSSSTSGDSASASGCPCDSTASSSAAAVYEFLVRRVVTRRVRR